MGKVFRVEKNKNKIIADFHVLGLFMGKKHVLSKKFFPFVTRRCTQIFVTPRTSPSKASKLKFWLLEYFGPT
jgi:hypothetical protein